MNARALIETLEHVPHVKESTRHNTLINAITMIRRKDAPHDIRILEGYRKVLELRMLREQVHKARPVSKEQLIRLIKEAPPMMLPTVSLAVATGARFQDLKRIRRADVTFVDRNVISIRIFQTKTIRSRKHQRWLTIVLPVIRTQEFIRLLKAMAPEEEICKPTYRQYMQFLKVLGTWATTYSIRLGVFEEMRKIAHSIQEITAVTLHRNEDQLRWYLGGPLPDEMAAQMRISSWHL